MSDPAGRLIASPTLKMLSSGSVLNSGAAMGVAIADAVIAIGSTLAQKYLGLRASMWTR